MGKEEFIQGYRQEMIDNNPRIKQAFLKAGSNEEKDRLYNALDYSLGVAYEKYAKEYFDSKGVGSYLSTLLRAGGAVSDFVGTYMFWALGGAGFGFKGLGLLEKSVADAIDEAHYVKHAKHDTLESAVKDQAKIVGEGMAERVLAYIPLGVGEAADLLRGRSKYDKKVTYDAVNHAAENFYDYIRRPEDNIKMASLDNFKRKPETNFAMAA